MWRNTQAVEGTGLENRKVMKVAPGFESLFLRHIIKAIPAKLHIAR